MEIIVTPEFTFTWEWFVGFLKDVLSKIFDFIGEEEGWTEEATEA